MPSYAERLSFFDDDMFDETLGEPGKEPETEAEKALAKKRLANRGRKMMQNLGSRLGEFIAEVNIVRAKDSFVFQSFDQLNFDSDMVAVVTECANRLIGKHEVGNPQ
jgi:hypothetical protein